MKYLPLLICFLLACQSTPKDDSSSSSTPKLAEGPEWISLFNGKDLTGWTPKIAGYPAGENFKNTFVVQDGEIRADYSQYTTFKNEFGHLFYKTPYKNYRLRIEYRFLGEQVTGGPSWANANSGVMFHAQAPETMKVDQPFPVCLEAQFLARHGPDPRPTMNLCTPGTHVTIGDEFTETHCIDSESKTYEANDWVTAEIIVHGEQMIHHLVNGDTVLSYHHPVIGGQHGGEDFVQPAGTPLASGYFALQAESHPTAFRNIEIMILPD